LRGDLKPKTAVDYYSFGCRLSVLAWTWTKKASFAGRENLEKAAAAANGDNVFLCRPQNEADPQSSVA
jgi:hypothetical protein